MEGGNGLGTLVYSELLTEVQGHFQNYFALV